jgi:hypothetical protein
MNLPLCVEDNQQHGSSNGQILYAVTSLNRLGPEISGPSNPFTGGRSCVVAVHKYGCGFFRAILEAVIHLMAASSVITAMTTICAGYFELLSCDPVSTGELIRTTLGGQRRRTCTWLACG